MQKLRALFAVLLTVVTLAHSTPSEAVVGKIIHNRKVVTVGLAMTGTGAAVAFGGAAIVSATCVDLGCLAALFPIVIGGAIAIAGLVTLDGEQEMQFKALNESEAMKLGVSESDRLVFNSEVDQATMLLNDVEAEVSKLEAPTAADSAALWSMVKDLVSPATFSTMQKIVSQN